MNTVTLVIRESTIDRAIYVHRAFERPMEAIHCTEELNHIADIENLPCVWYTFTLVLE